MYSLEVCAEGVKVHKTSCISAVAIYVNDLNKSKA